MLTLRPPWALTFKRTERRIVRKGIRNWGPPLLLVSPTIIILGIFVYGLIAANIAVSTTNRHSLSPDSEFVGLENYLALLSEDRFLHSLFNLVMFTVVFIAGPLLFGFIWAWMLDKGVRAEGVFHSVFLFPMAISFVASGVVWRWLLNSAEGDRASGLNRIFESLGLGFLQNAACSGKAG